MGIGTGRRSVGQHSMESTLAERLNGMTAWALNGILWEGQG